MNDTRQRNEQWCLLVSVLSILVAGLIFSFVCFLLGANSQETIHHGLPVSFLMRIIMFVINPLTAITVSILAVATILTVWRLSPSPFLRFGVQVIVLSVFLIFIALSFLLSFLPVFKTGEVVLNRNTDVENEMSEAVVTGAEVTEVGIYTAQVTKVTTATNIIAQKLECLDGFTLLQGTTNVPARMGTRFGFRYRTLGRPTNAPIMLTMVGNHPPFSNPKTGKTASRDEYQLQSWIGDTYTSFCLDEEWELIPGKWTFEVWHKGKRLCEQSFMVVPDEEKKGLSKESDLTAGVGDKPKNGIEIRVRGDVHKAGICRFRKDEPCTMMHLLFKMGGLSRDADGRNAVIRRKSPGGVEEIKVNVMDLLGTEDSEKDVPLKDGDEVIIPKRLYAI